MVQIPFIVREGKVLNGRDALLGGADLCTMPPLNRHSCTEGPHGAQDSTSSAGFHRRDTQAGQGRSDDCQSPQAGRGQ